MWCLSDASVARGIRPFFFESMMAEDLLDLRWSHDKPPRLEPRGNRARIGLRVCVMDDIEEHLDDHGAGREEHCRRPGLEPLAPRGLLRSRNGLIDADVEKEACEHDASDALGLGELTHRVVDGGSAAVPAAPRASAPPVHAEQAGRSLPVTYGTWRRVSRHATTVLPRRSAGSPRACSSDQRGCSSSGSRSPRAHGTRWCAKRCRERPGSSAGLRPAFA